MTSCIYGRSRKQQVAHDKATAAVTARWRAVERSRAERESDAAVPAASAELLSVRSVRRAPPQQVCLDGKYWVPPQKRRSSLPQAVAAACSACTVVFPAPHVHKHDNASKGGDGDGVCDLSQTAAAHDLVRVDAIAHKLAVVADKREALVLKMGRRVRSTQMASIASELHTPVKTLRAWRLKALRGSLRRKPGSGRPRKALASEVYNWL
jgi:hypothetical protein